MLFVDLGSLLFPALIITHRNEAKVQNTTILKPVKKLILWKEIVTAQKHREKMRNFPSKINFTKSIFYLCGSFLSLRGFLGTNWIVLF